MAQVVNDQAKLSIIPYPDVKNQFTQIILRRSWIPMQIWSDTEVVIEDYSGISPLEKFIIELVHELEIVNASDIEEITSIPIELSRNLLSVLEQNGYLLKVDKGYELTRDSTGVVNTETSNVKIIKRYMNFIWFPITGEVLCIHDAPGLLKRFDKVEPYKRIKTPNHFLKVKKREILIQALNDKKIINLPDDIVEFNDISSVDPVTPVYLAKGEVQYQNGESCLDINLFGKKKRKKSRNATENDEILVDQVNWKGLANPFHQWVDMKQFLYRESLVQKLLDSNIKIHDIHKENETWTIKLTDIQAQAIQKQCLLLNDMGIRIEYSDQSVMEIPVICIPAFPTERKEFDSDLVVVNSINEYNENGISKPKIMQECRKVPSILQYEDVYDRLWQLKHYDMIYQLREEEDFSNGSSTNSGFFTQYVR